MKKVVRIVILSILAFSFFVACKNYTADIDDYLSYWSTESSIADYTFDPSPQTDAEGVRWVSSKTAVTVTFTVNNPKNFNFKMPGDVDAPADIVIFPRIRNEPDKNAAITSQPGIDYEFKKISNTKLALTYTPVFLQKHEWGREDITPSIMLYTMDGRHFKQDLQFALKVNTPPPTITHYTVAKTKIHDVGKDTYYVLCLQIPNMDVSVPGGLLHKDIVGIEINGTPYPLSVNEAQHTFIKPEDTAFLDVTDVEKLEANADDIPSDWVLYFKTDVPVKEESEKKGYTVKLTDAKGLTSSELKASTKPNKLQKEAVTVAKGETTGTGNGTESSPIIIGTGDEGAAVMISSQTPNTTVHCVLTEVGQAPAPEQTGSPSVTVVLPLNRANEKRYKLEYYTDGEGFAATARQTSYYKILLKHTVTFNLAGGNIDGNTNVITMTGIPGTSFTKPVDPIKEGYTFNAWNPALPTPLVFPAANAEYIAQWTKNGNTRYIIEHYKQNIDDNNYILADTQSLQGETGASISVAPKTYEGFTWDHQEPAFPTIAAGGNTVVKVYYNRKRITVTFKLDGGKIGSSTADVTREDKFGATLTKPVDPTREGYTFSGWNPSLPTPPVFPAADTTYTAQWTPKTYTVKFKVDGGQGGSLKGTYNGADRTASGSPEQQFKSVPYNGTINFTATPDSGYEVDSWTGGATPEAANNKKASLTVQNNATVTVKFKAVGGQSQVVTDWIALRKAVQDASDGAVIEIANDITYGFLSPNSTIEVKKNITIKSKGSTIYTLSANGRGAADNTAFNARSTGIFEVENGKTLTLENLILTKTEKYAIYVAEGDNSLTMKNVTIKDCKTKDNAAGIYFNKGKTLTLENCRIEKCKGKGSQSSGGIDIQVPTETVSIKDTTIENCEAKANGGGIHLYQGECTLENVTVNNCSALRGGGLHVKEGTLTITGGSFTKNKASGTGTDIQGGAIYSEDGRLTLKSCMIGGDNSGDGNRAKKGGGIYLKNVALTMQSVTVKNNKALTQGAGIYLAAGELKIPGGNTIANNSIIDNGNSEAGGGIYVEKGMLTLDGGSIDGNSANANKGGGVHLKAGTFTMNSGEIKNCSAKYGGGVSLAGKSSFTMKGGSITGCKANVEGGVGGGIYTGAKTQLTLEGTNSNPVVISNCTAKKTGGGMHIYTNNPVTVKNARIEGNTAENGGGVYLEQGTFTIAGSTRITPSAGKNDVFLKGGKFITIEGTLTETGTVARITPENYADGVRVLQALPTECAKFTVTPNSAGTWQVESNGTLKKQ